MNYLDITLGKKAVTLKLIGENRLLIAEAEVTLLEQKLVDTLDTIIKIVKAKDWQFDGISVELIARSESQAVFIEETTCFIKKHLAEGLNCPVVFADEVVGRNDLKSYFKETAEKMTWNLEYVGYEPGKTEYSVESMLTIGNGFIGLRGTLPEMTISDEHYPATYLAGLYNAAESMVNGQPVINEDFVNAPNSQYLSIQVEGAEVIAITEETVQSLHRQLNLKDGLFTSTMVVKDASGHQLKIESQRIVSMANKQDYGIHYSFTPLNFSGDIKIIAKNDGGVFNYNVARYRDLTKEHLVVKEIKAEEEQAMIAVATRQSDIAIIQKSQLTSPHFNKTEIANEVTDEVITQVVELTVTENQTYIIEKMVKVFVHHPNEKAQITSTIAKKELFKSFQHVYEESRDAWTILWQDADIEVTGDMMSQKLLRLHTYHLLVSGSPFNTPELDVSITARGLHGEAYRGHIFWDEIFILPFYIMHFPETAKELLMYRYNRLEAAKESAQLAGYSGAMYPWQSGLDGTEQTQEVHLNPLTNEWGEDYSRLQRHVSLAIAYNIWLYWNNTHDKQFMINYGAEMLLEIAEFWRSKAIFDETTQSYSIDKVMGPDEFHEAYPESETGGLKNNAYTNMMVVWLFEEVANLVTNLSQETFSELTKKTAITTKKISEMESIRRQLLLEISNEGIIAQYQGYLGLKEVDWAYYKKEYGNIYRMDRILRAEGKSADDYQVAKQADTLMIFYNFSKEKVDLILADLGYELPENYLEKNLEYYLKRTSHGSTLSRIVHAQLAEIVGKRELSWQLYQEALGSDYQDIQGGTTAEGIHTGVMAGTLNVTLATYGGVEIREDLLEFHPDLPKEWQKLSFNMQRQGVHYQISVEATTITLIASQDCLVSVVGQKHALKKNQKQVIPYDNLVKNKAVLLS